MAVPLRIAATSLVAILVFLGVWPLLDWAAVDQATGNIMGIGLDAKRMLGRTPGSISAIRPSEIRSE